MRIGLDARTVFGPQRRGIGKSLAALYRHLAEVRPDWQVTAFHRTGMAPTGDGERPLLPGVARSIEMPGDRFDAWQRWRLPLAARLDQCDVLHCPANLCPDWLPVPAIVTIHDLIPLDMPHGRPVTEVQRFGRSVRRACRRAARIVTPSHDTRQRLIDDFAADPAMVTVVPWAADEQLQALPPIERAASPMVLHFGAGEIRKNTHRVIEAWAMLKAPLRNPWRLVIVGLDDAAMSDMRRCVERLNLGHTVSLSGFVSDDRACELQREASILAYPSLAEGFGLPVLDAFAADTAVLTADSGAIREVAADAAHYTDPTDACAIAKSLTRLMTDPIYRRKLIARGRVQLQHYSWRLPPKPPIPGPATHAHAESIFLSVNVIRNYNP
jgi:glycosyltransferase involved in cell wall biosynthesis